MTHTHTHTQTQTHTHLVLVFVDWPSRRPNPVRLLLVLLTVFLSAARPYSPVLPVNYETDVS